ncbi:MAG TPA: hypothetical protein VGA82_05520 [Dehalococcoidales bacterium]
MNRTRGFVNQNRFKSGRSVKRLSKLAGGKYKKTAWGKNRSGRPTEITIT